MSDDLRNCLGGLTDSTSKERFVHVLKTDSLGRDCGAVEPLVCRVLSTLAILCGWRFRVLFRGLITLAVAPKRGRTILNG
eukprot:1804571-Amphidinium_carterae.1